MDRTSLIVRKEVLAGVHYVDDGSGACWGNSIMYLQGFYALSLGLVLGASGIVSANAQVDPDLSPLIAPIQPEPRLGLPNQAPNILPVAEPPVVTSPRPATASPSSTSQQQRQAATAPTRPEMAGTWETECAEGGTSASGCQAV